MSVAPRRRLRHDGARPENQAGRRESPADEARGRLQQEVADFLRANPVCESVAMELQQLEPSLQRQVLDCGFFDESVRNPSKVLKSRIQAAKSGDTNALPGRFLRRPEVDHDPSLQPKPPPGPPPSLGQRDAPPRPPQVPQEPAAEPTARGPVLVLLGEDEQVELYLRQTKVSAQAAHALRCLRPEVQRHIMRTMPEEALLQSPNPSAALWSGITRTLKSPNTEEPAAMRKPLRSTRGRSRMVSVVRHPQRRAGTRGPARDDFEAPKGHLQASVKEGSDARTLDDDVKAFVAKHNLDRQAAEELQSLPAAEQRHVLKKDPSTTKHPSLAVFYHCRKVRDGLAERERAERAAANVAVSNPQDVFAAKRARYGHSLLAPAVHTDAYSVGGAQLSRGRGAYPATVSATTVPGGLDSRGGGMLKGSARSRARNKGAAPGAPQALAFTLVRCGGATTHAPPDIELPAVPRKFVIGRDAANCDIVFNIQHVSKAHAVLHLSEVGDGSWLLMLQDTSTHGTRLNGQKMTPRRLVQVQPGDLISFLPPHASGNVSLDLLTYEVVAGDAGDGDSGGTGTPPLCPGDASEPGSSPGGCANCAEAPNAARWRPGGHELGPRQVETRH